MKIEEVSTADIIEQTWKAYAKAEGMSVDEIKEDFSSADFGAHFADTIAKIPEVASALKTIKAILKKIEPAFNKGYPDGDTSDMDEVFHDAVDSEYSRYAYVFYGIITKYIS